MLSRINYYVVLALLLLSAVVYLALNRHLTALSYEVAHAKFKYTDAVGYSQIQLSSRLNSLARDQVLTANLEWGLTHSVVKELEAQLGPHHLEQLQITTAGCEILAEAALKGRALDRCALNLSTPQQIGTFVWIEKKGQPVLLLVLPVPSKSEQSLFIAGTVVIDNQWLAAHPSLRVPTDALKLSIIGSQSDSPPLIATVPALATDNFWLKRVPSLRYGSWHSGQPVAFYMLVVALIATLILMWQQQQQAQTRRDEQQRSFLDWLKKQVDGGGNPSGSSNNSEPDKAPPSLNSARSWVAAFVEAQSQRHKKLKAEQAAARRIVEEQKIQLANLATELDKATIQGSAAEVLVNNQGRLQRLVGEIDSGCEDLSDIASHGIKGSVETIVAILKPWRNEIEKRGVRRFWRALAEQESEQGTSVLEEQLALLDQVGSRLSDQMINHSLQSQQLRQRIHQLKDLGEQLEQSIDPRNAEPAESAIDVICAAQDILGASPQAFSNQFPFDGSLLMTPNVPKALLIMAMQSLYRSLLAEPDSDRPVVTTVKRDRNGSYLWVLSREAKPTDNFNKDLFTRTESLLKDYSISIELLPTGDQLPGIVLRWQSREAGINPTTPIRPSELM